MTLAQAELPEEPESHAALIRLLSRPFQAPSEPTTLDWWPTRQPLPRLSERIPRLDPELIPTPLRPHILDEARRLGVHPEHILVAHLLQAATIIGTTAKVQVKANDTGYTAYPILWAALVGPPSARKTPALMKGIAFLRRIESAKQAEQQQSAPRRSAKHKVISAQKDTLLKKLKGDAAIADPVKTAELTDRLAELEQELTTIDEAPRRFVVNDTTPEKLTEIAAANPAGFLVHVDELESLFAKMSKRGNESLRQLLLQAYNGLPHADDRIGRGTTRAETVAVSLLGGMQPSKLKTHTDDLARNEGDDGFFARLQLLVWINHDDLPYEQDVSPDHAAREAAHDSYARLEAEAEARLNTFGPSGDDAIRFTDDAQHHIDRWRHQLEEQSRRHVRNNRAAWAAHLGKSGDTAARIALILHMLDRASGSTNTRITLDQAERATGLMTFFLEHAERTYKVPESGIEEKVRRVSEYIEREPDKVHGAPTSVIQQNVRGFENADEVRAVLQRLEDRGWLRTMTVKNRGARDSTIIQLHPDLRRGSSPAAPPNREREQLVN